MLRRNFVTFIPQPERMSKVLKHVFVVPDGNEHVVKESDIFNSPYEGVPASAFSLHEVLASGGSLSPAPSVHGSNVESRDALDSNLSNVRTEIETKKQQTKFENDYKTFRESLGLKD